MNSFTDASMPQVQEALDNAQLAFDMYRDIPGKEKAAFLRAIADEIDASGEDIVQTAMGETSLPSPRITGERNRTTFQLRMFADYVEEGSWMEVRIDTAQPGRTPLPKPDLRKMMVGLGPVVVFGASNFPLAYSTAGGDTASALAAGCPVIVKAHPAHPRTSQLVAQCVERAIKKTKMPEHVFQHLYGARVEVGEALVKHPLTKAVGFTGSFAGGKALYDMAQKRPEPIPVFSEMGSINPVVILPGAVQHRKEAVAEMYAHSITLSVGQFCTNPGLIFCVEDGNLGSFISLLGEKLSAIAPAPMLHDGIAKNYANKRGEALKQKGVTLVTPPSKDGSEGLGMPTLAKTTLGTFLSNPLLAEEVFGPYSLMVTVSHVDELVTALKALPGQLTATVMAHEGELESHRALVAQLQARVGRLIYNGVPTGVEVCPAMMHGGPFPSTTDSRFTSVGIDAIKRFLRPVSFQNFPQALLPDALKDGNPLNIRRMVDGKWER